MKVTTLLVAAGANPFRSGQNGAKTLMDSAERSVVQDDAENRRYVVYNLTPNMWEGQWVRHLLAELPISRYEILDLWSPPPVNPRRRRLSARVQSFFPPLFRPTRRALRRIVHPHNFSVFVYNTWGLDIAVRSEFSKLLSRFRHVGIVSVDEPSRDSSATYDHVTFAVRIGFDLEKYRDAKNLLVVPLGVPNNFVRPPSVRAIRDRRFSWSFLGEIKNANRQNMVSKLSTLKGESFVHATSAWNSTDSLSGVDYSDVLANAVFVPSPPANVHLECYRTYEALECGAIPVVDTTYYRDTFDAPFPIVEPTWEDAPEVLNAFLDRRESLEELHQRCTAWWEDAKQSYPQKVRRLADGA